MVFLSLLVFVGFLFVLFFFSLLCVCMLLVFVFYGAYVIFQDFNKTCSEHFTVVVIVIFVSFCNESCSFTWAASRPFCVAETLMLDITHRLFSQFFSYLPCWLAPVFYNLITTFSDLDLVWGSQGQCSTKAPGFIFLHTWTEWMKFAIEVERPDTNFWLGLNEIREMTAVLLTASKNFQAAMHSDIYEMSWFKLGMMIDTVEPFFSPYTSLIKLQGYRSARKQTLLRQLPHKILNRCGLNLVYCWDVLVWWTSYSYCLCHSILLGENPAYVIFFFYLMFACIQTFTGQFLSNLIWW